MGNVNFLIGRHLFQKYIFLNIHRTLHYGKLINSNGCKQLKIGGYFSSLLLLGGGGDKGSKMAYKSQNICTKSYFVKEYIIQLVCPITYHIVSLSKTFHIVHSITWSKAQSSQFRVSDASSRHIHTR